MSRRGQTAAEIYYFWVSAFFIVVGFWALMSMSNAYQLEQANEGIGFRQAAALETFRVADNILLFGKLSATHSFHKGLFNYYSNSMRPEFEGTTCGRIGGYPLWNNQDENCFRENLWEDEGLWTTLIGAYTGAWNHPHIQTAIQYRFNRESSNEGFAQISAQSIDNLFIPVVGVRGDTANRIYDVMGRATVTQTTRDLSQADSTLIDNIITDPFARVNRARGVDSIVIHATAGSSKEGAIEHLRKTSDVSAHYIIDQNGLITQMVAENIIAYHAGGCQNDRCAIPNMNARSVGIELVNLLWQQPGTLERVRADTQGNCPAGYEYGRRDCSFESFENRPQDIAECEGYKELYACWQTYPQAQLERAAKLTADIAYRHNIPIDREHILTHEEIRVDKHDPGPAFPWDEFLQAVRQELEGLKRGEAPEPQETTEITIDEEEAPQQAASSASCLAQSFTGAFEAGNNNEVLTTQQRLENEGLFELVAQAEDRYGLPRGLLYAKITQESTGDRFAVSATGCAGIAQFCAPTARGPANEIGDYFDRSTITTCSCRQPGNCRLETSTCSSSDDRFDPRKSIFAGAKYLRWNIDRFQDFSDRPQFQIYLGMQAYNTGVGAVRGLVGQCSHHQNFDTFLTCMEERMTERAAGRNDLGQPRHGRHTLEFFTLWGGSLEGFSGATVCDDVVVRGLGRLSFTPDFVFEVPDVITPLENLVAWARALVENTNDNLHLVQDQLSTAPPGWEVTKGFCEGPLEQAHYELSSQITECFINNQSMCGCEITLAEGFEALFTSDGASIVYPVSELEKNNVFWENVLIRRDTLNTSVLDGVPFAIVDNTAVDLLRLQHDENGLFWSSLTLEEGEELNNESEWVYVDTPLVFTDGFSLSLNSSVQEQCLDTKQRQAFCATNQEQYLLYEGSAKNPVAHFGLTFNDSVMPMQSDSTTLIPQGPIESPTGFIFAFNRPRALDLSGVFVYCQFPGQDNFTMHSRIREEELGNAHSIDLSVCDGQGVIGAPGSTYRAKIHSFDYGANKNKEETTCNTASFTVPEPDDDFWSIATQAAFGDWATLYQAYQEGRSFGDAFDSWVQNPACRSLDD